MGNNCPICNESMANRVCTVRVIDGHAINFHNACLGSPEPMINTAENLKNMQFDSMEDLDAWVQQQAKKATKAVKSPKKPTASRTPKPNKSTQPVGKGTSDTAGTIRPDIFQATHFYMRNGEWNNTLANAKEERRFRNDNVVVVAHAHIFGEACHPLCKEFMKNE